MEGVPLDRRQPDRRGETALRVAAENIADARRVEEHFIHRDVKRLLLDLYQG
jgi:hypothetical protein